MTVSNEEIDPSIIVVIKEPCAPANVRQAHGGDLGGIRKVRERVLSVVMVERVVFVGKISDEQIKLAVVVAYRDAHRSLFAAVLVNTGTRNKSNLFKRAVTLVSKMKVWS